MVKNIGDKSLFEMLWQSAVNLRGALEPGEYKHPVLGLLCSGQLILATDLYSSQYLFSDSLGVSPPL